MSYLNRKCTFTFNAVQMDENGNEQFINIHWPSAKCIEENNGFVLLARYDKSKGTYDTTNPVWIDLTDSKAIISWR